MARLGKEHLGDMSDEGAQVKARRERLGETVKGLAEAAGVNRNTLAAMEAGESFNRSTLTKVERALADLELEAGIDTPTVRAEEQAERGPRIVVVRLKNDIGEVVLEGPVEDMAALEAAAARLLRQMGNTSDS